MELDRAALERLKAGVMACPALDKIVTKGDKEEIFQSLLDRAGSLTWNKRWVPVAIGTKEEMEVAAAWWRKLKLTEDLMVEANVVPAPMLRTTLGGGRRIGIMPWSYKSMAEELSTLYTNIYHDLHKQGKYHMLPHLDQGELLQINTHGMRRGADAEAVALAPKSGATADDINMVFRWKLSELSNDMRLRYRGNAGAELKLNVLKWM